MVQAFWSGSVQRPVMRFISLNSCSSRTELAVGFTELSGFFCCCAPTGIATATAASSTSTPTALRMRAKNAAILFLLLCPLSALILRSAEGATRRMGRPSASRRRFAPPQHEGRLSSASGRDGLAIGGAPSPGTGAVATLDHALLVDLGDDLA